MGGNTLNIKALRNVCTVLCTALFYTGQSQSLQIAQIPVPGPDSVIVVMSKADYQNIVGTPPTAADSYNSPQYSLTDLTSIINRLLGLSESMMSPKEYNQKTAMKALKMQRKELGALLKDYNKERITLEDYLSQIKQHYAMDFSPE